jgi:hypothetical protein
MRWPRSARRACILGSARFGPDCDLLHGAGSSVRLAKLAGSEFLPARPVLEPGGVVPGVNGL